MVKALKDVKVRRIAVDAVLRDFQPDDTSPSTKVFATAKLFDTGEEVNVATRARRIFDKYDEDGGGTIDSEELAAIFADMGVDVGTEDIENLIGEYGGQEGVDEDTGMITEINFDEFVNMVAALPPTATCATTTTGSCRPRRTVYWWTSSWTAPRASSSATASSRAPACP